MSICKASLQFINKHQVTGLLYSELCSKPHASEGQNQELKATCEAQTSQDATQGEYSEGKVSEPWQGTLPMNCPAYTSSEKRKHIVTKTHGKGQRKRKNAQHCDSFRSKSKVHNQENFGFEKPHFRRPQDKRTACPAMLQGQLLLLSVLAKPLYTGLDNGRSLRAQSGPRQVAVDINRAHVLS